jgi:hypothetical protein
MNASRRAKRGDDTAEWKGAYAPYDLVKELCIAIGVVTLLAVVLTVLFSSPDDKPTTIAQWASRTPVNFATTAVEELDGSSGIATYGPPYNHNGEGQHAAFLYPQKWLGVNHPINTANDFVVKPLKTIDADDTRNAILAYQAAPAKTQKSWTDAYAKALEKGSAAPGGSVAVAPGNYGPVQTMMESELYLAQSGLLEGELLSAQEPFQTDFTKPLLFMADGGDGGLLAERAHEQHLEGKQWGMMNETGSYPGQVWLWLYTFWYQIEPFKASANADVLVMLIMTVLSLAFVLIPLIPGIRGIPRRIPVYKLIWREHYRSTSASGG